MGWCVLLLYKKSNIQWTQKSIGLPIFKTKLTINIFLTWLACTSKLKCRDGRYVLLTSVYLRLLNFSFCLWSRFIYGVLDFESIRNAHKARSSLIMCHSSVPSSFQLTRLCWLSYFGFLLVLTHHIAPDSLVCYTPIQEIRRHVLDCR
jgi:hypothetical protein